MRTPTKTTVAVQARRIELAAAIERLPKRPTVHTVVATSFARMGCDLQRTEVEEKLRAAVDGYVRRDGTYVAPHARTNPNGVFEDNYSTRGNTNPYSGQQGARVTPPDPYGYNNFYRR